MKLRSPAFERSQMIPAQYTCEGQDVSPALYWQDAPEGTRSFALIADDPDAPSGDWTHWVVYNIPPGINQLPAHMPATGTLADGTMQGENDFGKTGYGGPCPPKGHGAHHYYFHLYSLDSKLSLPPGAKKRDLLDAMENHILEETAIHGLFGR